MGIRLLSPWVGIHVPFLFILNFSILCDQPLRYQLTDIRLDFDKALLPSYARFDSYMKHDRRNTKLLSRHLSLRSDFGYTLISFLSLSLSLSLSHILPASVSSPCLPCVLFLNQMLHTSFNFDFFFLIRCSFRLKNFFKDPWNTFDFVTVVGSIIDALVVEFGVNIWRDSMTPEGLLS